MSTSMADAKAEVHRVLGEAVALVDDRAPQRLEDVEQRLWTLMLALGRALMVWFLVVQARRLRPATYTHDGRQFHCGHLVRTDIGTLFGKVPFTRVVGVGAVTGRGRRDFPVDRELGLCSGFSLPVLGRVVRLCAQLSFGTAREVFADIHGWAPSSRGVLRMVDAAGALARPFLEQASAPKGDGNVLVIQMDGGGAPMVSPRELERRRNPQRRHKGETKRSHRKRRKQSSPKQRRKAGEKSKNAKVAFVGAIYTLKKTASASGLEGPVNKQICATFESHEALAIWLRHEADKRGAARKRVIFQGDGSEHIWRMQHRYFPEAETCVDWYHIIEKIWVAGECLHKAGSAELAAFVNVQVRRLRAGNVEAVRAALAAELERIPKTGPGNKGRRERLERVYAHLTENKERMPYDKFRRDGLDIGTGVIEGAVRNLVRVRFDGPGMRWSLGRAELLLHLRCILLNNQWQDFMAHLATMDRVRLPATPLPTKPHLAKAAA